jgi:hypothetical protein
MGAGSEHAVVARVLLVGDSDACSLSPGLEAVGAPAGVQIEDAAVIGCGVVSGQLAPTFFDGRDVTAFSSRCQSADSAAETRALRSGRPNVVLWSSSWERAPLLVHQKVLPTGSPQWYSVLKRRMEDKVRQFTALGATVVLLTQPPDYDPGNPSGPTQSDRDFERLNRLITDFAARTPGVKVVDLAGHVCPSGPPCPLLVDNVWVRGDGQHYSSEGALWAARWLMPQLGIPALEHAATPPPTVTMLRPSNGAVLNGALALVARTSFSVGVARVQFQVTGGTLRKAVVSPAFELNGFWGARWDTRNVPDGTYKVRSMAFNSAGNSSLSKAVTVKVMNARNA